MPAQAATFTVNSTADGADAAADGVCETAAGNGVCTLRAAIQEANAASDADTINFSVTGTITVASNLPAITAGLTISAPNPSGSVIVSGGGNFSLLRYTGASTADYFITNLTLQNGTAATGGALSFAPTAFSTMALTDVTVKDSVASSGAGGGIALAGTATNVLTMTRGAVTGNSSSAGDGGGIGTTRGELTLTDVTVSGNDAVNGGGIGLAGGKLTLTGSTISGNSASQDGGGLFVGAVVVPTPVSSSANLKSCTIAGNIAANGGGIGASSTNNAASSMVHCTVAGNFATAAGGGGGIGVFDPVVPAPPATANANKFFAGNDANPFTSNLITDNFISPTTSPPPNAPRSDCRQVFGHSDTDDSGFNIESAATCGFTQAGDRQNVGGCTNGLADRLGLTQTRGLSGGCIAADRALDRANPKHATTTDQRGAPLADGDENTTVVRDIGAYEFGAYGAVRFSSGGITVREDAGTVTAQLDRFGNLGTTTNVDFSANSGCGSCDATENADYTTQTGTRSWTSGDGGLKDIVVVILDDTVTAEGNDVFQVTLSNLTKGADFGSPAGATVTITDIEKGALQLSSAAEQIVCEAENDPLDRCATEAFGTVSFTVQRVGANADPDPVGDPNVSVTFQTQNGSATGGAACSAGVDFISVNTVLTWAADNRDNQTVTVTVCNDIEFEADQSFTGVLSNPTNGARLGNPTSQPATIISNDPADPGELRFSASNFNVDETAGTVTVTVQRVNGDDQSASVDYRTSGGSAQAGVDYISASGTVTWAADTAGDKTFTVAITNDALREGAEQFSVILENPRNNDAATPDPVLVAPSTATVTINSEDLMKFRFTQSSWTAIEGSSVTILVEPTQAVVDGPFTIDYATGGGSATAGSDYTATSGSLVFNNGETAAKSFVVPTTTDALVEGNETFDVTLSTANPVAQILAPNPTTVTISEDDTGFALSAASYTVAEDVGTVTVTVNRSGSSSGAFTVDYATSDIAGSAVAGSDYTAASGTLTFADGDTSKTVDVSITNDALDEADEKFKFDLTAVSAGGQLLSPKAADITITDNDPVPTLTISSPSVTEGNSGTATLNFVVTLSAASGKTVTVDFASANGTATAGSDYNPKGGTLTFNPGQTSMTIAVTVLADTLDEDNETLTETLSNAVNATVSGTGVGTGTITDDDAAPTVSIGDATVTEGNTSDVVLAFPVTLSAASGRTVTVRYTTANGSAAAPGDFTAVNAVTITFSPGQTSRPANVTIKSDSADEQVETFTVTLSTPSNVTIADGSATGAINDAADDVPPPVSSGIAVTASGGGVSVAGGGAFSATGLLGLLGLLGLRRRRVLAAMLAVLAAVPGTAGAAGATGVRELSYNYADLRYVSVSIDEPNVGAAGFLVSASVSVAEPLFFGASYATAETDDYTLGITTGSSESTSWNAYAGYRRALRKGVDANAVLSFVSVEAEGTGQFTGDVTDTGIGLELGLRGIYSPTVEWGTSVSYLSIFDDDSVSLLGQGLYHFHPRFTFVGGLGLSDNSTALNLGLRYNFQTGPTRR